MAALLIEGGRVVDPASGLNDACDVLVSEGRVSWIGSAGAAPALPTDITRIDAAGCLVTPGLIDPHVHLRQPGQEHKETLESGSLAAVAGGFTTVCCMPNTNPAIDSPEIVHSIVAEAAKKARCRVFPVAAATRGRKGETPTEARLLADAGAVAFSDDGDVIASAGLMARCLTAAADTGLVFMQHCQEPTLTRGATMHAGEVSTRQGQIGWPREAEEIIIERDVRLAANRGAAYHVQHLSSGGSVEIIRRARDAGHAVTAEASPHHLLLTHEACESASGGLNPMAKMNPPLREQSDVDAIRAAVAEGVITVLATDHAPHTTDEKAVPFEDAPFGIIGLETALALYAEALVHSGLIDWARLIVLMTIEPARLCRLDRGSSGHGLGELREGGPADITIIDPDLEWTISEDDLAGKSANTPFLGRAVRGRATTTIVDGVVQWQVARAASAAG